MLYFKEYPTFKFGIKESDVDSIVYCKMPGQTYHLRIPMNDIIKSIMGALMYLDKDLFELHDDLMFGRGYSFETAKDVACATIKPTLKILFKESGIVYNGEYLVYH